MSSCPSITITGSKGSEATEASGFAWQILANNCPSGRTSWRFGSFAFNSRAKMWLSQANSTPCTVKRHRSNPAKDEHISSTASSSLTNSSCRAKSLAHCQIANVANSRLWRQNVALAISIFSDGNSTAITPEGHCMNAARRNLGVFDTLIQTWDGRQPYGASPQ